MRFRNIDLLTGLLVLCVMAGHVLRGPVASSFPRYLLYSFHMPLIIGISGYLFNVHKSVRLSAGAFFGKYLFRLVIPWILAVITYHLFLHAAHPLRSLDTYNLVLAFLHPYYHLWFVPAFLSWVFITWFLKKLHFSSSTIFLYSVLISVIAYLLQAMPTLLPVPEHFRNGLELALYTLRPQYYLFFALGVMIRGREISPSTIIDWLLLFVFLAANITLFFYPDALLSSFCFFLFNVFLLNVCVKMAKQESLPASPALEWLGRQSLGVYLWHLLPLLLVERWIPQRGGFLFYLVCIIALAIFIFLYRFLCRIPVVNKRFFGNVEPAALNDIAVARVAV